MTAQVYPASLAQKGAGWRYQGWCHQHQVGINTKTKAQAKTWVKDHNQMEDHS